MSNIAIYRDSAVYTKVTNVDKQNNLLVVKLYYNNDYFILETKMFNKQSLLYLAKIYI